MHFPIKSSRNPSIEYDLLSPEEADEVVRFCQHDFFVREPLSAASKVKLTPEDLAWYRRYVFNIIGKGLSYKAVDVTKNRQIVGVQLTRVVSKRPNDEGWDDFDEEENQLLSKSNPCLFIRPCSDLKKTFDFSKVDSYLANEITSVSRDYSRQGICFDLVTLAERYAKEQTNVRLLEVSATNPFSQKAYKRAGYEPVGRIKFNEYKVGDLLPFYSEGEDKQAFLLIKFVSD